MLSQGVVLSRANHCADVGHPSQLTPRRRRHVVDHVMLSLDSRGLNWTREDLWCHQFCRHRQLLPPAFKTPPPPSWLQCFRTRTAVKRLSLVLKRIQKFRPRNQPHIALYDARTLERACFRMCERIVLGQRVKVLIRETAQGSCPLWKMKMIRRMKRKMRERRWKRKKSGESRRESNQNNHILQLTHV